MVMAAKKGPGPGGGVSGGKAEAEAASEVWCRRVRELGGCSQAGNRHCFECAQRGVTYVDITVGSFVCTTCSGLLRGLNPPHRVKSISMTTFTEPEVLFLQSRGNEVCRKIWLGLFDARTSLIPDSRDPQKVKEFLQEKYEKKRWYVPPEQVKGPSYTKGSASAPVQGSIAEGKPQRTLLGDPTPSLSDAASTSSQVTLRPAFHLSVTDVACIRALDLFMPLCGMVILNRTAVNDVMATPACDDSSEVAVPVGPPVPWPCPPDVRLCGHLRKQKSQRRRFFVLRADPPRLDCYESEKKFRAAGGCRPARPRRSVSLEGACTISKRSDARQRHLIVLYTPDSSLGVAAADELEQQLWYSALLEVRAAAAAAAGVSATGPSSQEDPESCILTPFQDVWPVTLRPKGLGRAPGLGSGGYRLCLGSGALSLLRKPGSKGSRDSQTLPLAVLRLSLLSVRRCGHADSFFFLELGRSAPTGPGELWLQAPDAVVAQSIHETVLAAMKRLGRITSGGKVELPLRESPKISSSTPNLTVYDTPALAAQPKNPDERQEQELLKTLESLRAAASYPQELDPGENYITMRARHDYMFMRGSTVDGYMLMAPPGLTSTPDPHLLSQDYEDIEYMPMNNFSSEPSSYKSEPGFPAVHGGVGGSSQRLADLAGDYVYLQSGDTARREPPDSCLNYVDLDLVPPLEVRSNTPKAGPHSYASIKF